MAGESDKKLVFFLFPIEKKVVKWYNMLKDARCGACGFVLCRVGLRV